MKFQYVALDKESFVLTGVDCWNSSLFPHMGRPTWWDLFLLLLLKITLVWEIFVMTQECCVLDVLIASPICFRKDCYKLIIS